MSVKTKATGHSKLNNSLGCLDQPDPGADVFKSEYMKSVILQQKKYMTFLYQSLHHIKGLWNLPACILENLSSGQFSSVSGTQTLFSFEW